MASRLGLVVAACVAVCLATPDPFLQTLFDARAKGYVGTDLAVSVPLGDTHQVVWLLGNTLLGTSTRSQRHVVSQIANSVAKVDVRHLHASDVRFMLRSVLGKPYPVFDMIPRRDPNLFLRPGAGLYIQQADKLWVFADVCRAPHASESAALGDRACDAVSSQVAIVDNPHTDADQWEYQLYPLRLTDQFVTLTSAVVQHSDGFVYAFGYVTETDGKKRQILARLSLPNAVDQSVEGFHYYIINPETGKPDFTPYYDARSDLITVFPDGLANAEIGVAFSKHAKLFYALVHQGARVVILTAPAPTGPWIRGHVIDTIPGEFHADHIAGVHVHAELNGESVLHGVARAAVDIAWSFVPVHTGSSHDSVRENVPRMRRSMVILDGEGGVAVQQ